VNSAQWFVCVLALTGCTTPLATGERLYREGDRLGALETWRSIPSNASEYEKSQERVTIVEEEFNRLVLRYKQRARYFEAKDRLAESILDYRLALKLQPDDAETMAHVQELARVLASQKTERRARFRVVFEAGDLGAAREQLEQLRILDPIDPDIQTDERQLRDALRLAISHELTAGRRQFMAGNHESAQRHFRSVLALDPDNESAQGYISYIATIRRERESETGRSATFASQDGFASDAEIRAEGFYQNALAAQRRGHPFNAIRHDLRALQADSNHADARNHLQALRGRLSGSVDGLIEAGRNAYSEEDLQTALELWTRALLVDPRNQRARAYVDRARRQLQNLERLRSEPDSGSPAG
jgi:tetratricopeptide (TPR) repeat protein